MTRHERIEGAGFHEFPLVLFTALAIAGAGVGTAHLGLRLLGWVPLVPAWWVMALVGSLLVLGLLFSMGHLGRPFRSAFALFRVGRSPLSNEVLVLGVALVASLGSVTLPPGHSLLAPLTATALVSSVLTLFALGLVYRLPGQLAWAGPVFAQPLILGLAFGLTVLQGTLPPGTRARAELLILVVLLADGLLVWERTRRITRVLDRGVPTHPRIQGRRGTALLLRILMGVLLPAGALSAGWWKLAGALLFLNLFLDRILFYGLAVHSGTEAEVGRVVTALRAGAYDQ